MNRFKIQAFFKEFGFLAGLLEKLEYQEQGEVEEVYVKRIDKDFLEITPKYEGASGDLVGIADSERIVLLDEGGNILEEPRQASVQRYTACHKDDEEEEGKSVGEALSYLEDPNAVVYAVRIHTGFRIRNHRSVGGFSVTVYKPPRGFNLKDWVEEQRRRAKQMLAAEVAQIDAEA